jgi:4-hydroxybenzoate polyprenyltransferase
MTKGKAYVELARPFTLLPPALGVLSGAASAWGAGHAKPAVTWALALPVIFGTLMAAVLNAANNAINQIYDLEIDRVNKPKRPLPSGALSLSEAWSFTWATFLVAWVLAFVASPDGRRECFFIVLFTSVLCVIYSAPPFWTKRRGFLANITIAIPRGCLLKVAGWSMVASVFHVEPWFIGSIFFLFLVGASSTKDFSDMKGDAAAGCRTLPVRFGVAAASRLIAPFFVLPWLLMPLGAWVRDPWSPEHAILTGDRWVLTGLGFGLAIWGSYTVYLILRNPEDLAEVENHPSWTHMYLMMMAAQVGFAVAYLIPK